MINSKTDTREIREKDEKRKNRDIAKSYNKDAENKLYGYMKAVSNFLRDCKMELKRVKWPTRKELMASTAMVLFLVIVIAFFLGIMDELLVRIIAKVAA
jgi:preprotein translocase subunit SecE